MNDAAGRDWQPFMQEALTLAQSPDAPYGENPRVGCVLVNADGVIVGRGHHRGAGTPHAEVVAIVEAGDAARGATAVVTLEPCRHTGRTGPCTQALMDAGVTRVVFAQSDPTREAGGGAEVLRAAGLEVVGGVLADESATVNEHWTTAVRRGRPVVTWKCAVSLDGRVAGPDGGPTSLTGPEARTQVHRLRSRVGAIIVGTGTVLVDDPQLTVRLPEGEASAPAPQPIRVVMGTRTIPAAARVRSDDGPTLLTGSQSPEAVLADLYARGVRHALLEGGPTLAAAFLRAGLIDRIDWYIAPVVLGDGPVALPAGASDTPIGLDVSAVSVVGKDVRIMGRVRSREA